jgi:hypothetical protein
LGVVDVRDVVQRGPVSDVRQAKDHAVHSRAVERDSKRGRDEQQGGTQGG